MQTNQLINIEQQKNCLMYNINNEKEDKNEGKAKL